MLISAIVAVAQNGVIGHENQIPWYLPADLAYFKRITIDHPVIMGRNTWHSLGRPLPKRTNIVLTRDPFFVTEGALIVHDMEEAFELAAATGADEAFIIGGGKIYEQSQAYWDRIYLTEVELTAEGDVFFPEINMEEWVEISAEKRLADDKNPYNYTFKVFGRKNT